MHSLRIVAVLPVRLLTAPSLGDESHPEFCVRNLWVSYICPVRSNTRSQAINIPRPPDAVDPLSFAGHTPSPPMTTAVPHPRRSRLQSVLARRCLLALAYLFVYNANLRARSAPGATIAARYLPLMLWQHGTLEPGAQARLFAHGHSLALPRFRPANDDGNAVAEPTAYWLIRTREHELASFYPVVTPLRWRRCTRPRRTGSTLAAGSSRTSTASPSGWKACAASAARRGRERARIPAAAPRGQSVARARFCPRWHSRWAPTPG